MSVDIEFLKWLAEQTEEVARKVTPLVAKLLGQSEEKVSNFIDYLAQATETVLRALEAFINFPAVFGADGEGLTDANGNPCPDCPDCDGCESVVFALKAQAV